ncbi:hypothetical protein BGZ95_001047 [Linnemannia exigua]|uniref:Uncharacterized protein n=1 Tax=Linnemannia exigua TaxID=604196 RepID=A0AAD4D7G9_9FUNG|nr:hypothetical protein BGZ95_001047 [Linnemannia exigua]
MSYLHRAVSTSWFYIWFLFYVSRWDRFEAFRLRRLQRFELRSVVTVLVLLSLGLQLVYDIGSARLKYLEGFWTNPKTHEIQSKPAQAWTEEDILHVEPLYYTLACSLSLQNCAFFLLQAFWSYISKSVTKSSFMSSFEFKVYLVASCFAVALFPTVQYLFRNDFVYRENAALTLNDSTLTVLEKLEYFKDMNVILTFSVFACSFSLGIVAGDGISPHPKIAGNKFASDLLITNLNFFQVIIWVTLTLIFYPRKSVVSATAGSHNNSSGNPNHHHFNNNNNNNNNNINNNRHIINTNQNQQRHKRGPSDNFRLARRNNEVHSEEDEYDLESNTRHIPNDSKAQLAQNEVLDPYWAMEREGARSPRYDQQQHRRHHRAFSGDSRNDTAITLTSLSPPRPSLTIVTSSAGTPDIAMHEAGMTSPTSPPASLRSPPPASLRSPTSPTGMMAHSGSGKPGTETRTLYYHEALAKAQQQQQHDQANEYYNMTLASSSAAAADAGHVGINNSSSASSGTSRPERSTHRPAPSTNPTQGRSTPTVDYQPRTSSAAAGRITPAAARGTGAMSPVASGRSASSMDVRSPDMSSSSANHEIQRMRSSGSSKDKTHHRRTSSANTNNNYNGNRILNPVTAPQEMEMMKMVDPRTVSALGHHHAQPYQQQQQQQQQQHQQQQHQQQHQGHRRQNSEESDMSVIQIAYVGNMSQAQQQEQQSRQQQPQQESYAQGEFYDGLSSSALRPYSPR